jgi:hypothetical protein
MTFLLAYGRKRSEEMNNREYLKMQIDELPDHIIEQIQEYVSFQRFSLGLFENDTDYLNAIPGMSEIIMKGLKTPVSECFGDLE